MAETRIKSRWSDENNTPAPAPDVPLKENDNTAAHQGGQDNLILPYKEKLESKTRRFNAVFRQSSYDKFSQIAKAKGYSVNDLLNQVVENFINSSSRQPTA